MAIIMAARINMRKKFCCLCALRPAAYMLAAKSENKPRYRPKSRIRVTTVRYMAENGKATLRGTASLTTSKARETIKKPIKRISGD
jgi:hypothetical protein